MSRDHDQDRDDLAALLGDLRTTLDDLERTLDADDGSRRSTRRDPPRGSDVVRFTEEYTIPTVIAILETTIQSLELLRGVLRLANPERSLREEQRGLDSVDRRVVDGTERALDDLRRVLTGTEEPSDPVARDVFREARDLTAEIESRLGEARETERDSRSRPGRRTSENRGGGVVIPVDDEHGDGETDAERAETVDEREADGSGVEIDVDAELESIREEVRDESAATDGDGDRTDETESDRRDDESDGN
jgi:hypothetical protein